MTLAEKIADAVLSVAGSGGLRAYMPRTQAAIVAAVNEAMSDLWQPIETAPKGRMRTVPAGKDGERTIHEPDVILAPTSDGKVTMTYWIPKSERWSMFTKTCPPTHWQPLPAAPKGGAA